ncbi:MAG: pyrimidine reductase family protein [Mycobacteriales bacterium]
MDQLFPHRQEDVDPLDAYDVPDEVPVDRPYVVINMVSSLDGATAQDGVTAALSSPGDKRVFFALRNIVDVVLVGATTVRTEGYGTVRVDERSAARRQARGQHPVAALAIVSASLDLDWSSPLFTKATRRPFVIAPRSSDAERLRQAAAAAELVLAGEHRVDLRAAFAVLRSGHDVRTVLCEGGPTLNAQLVAAGLVDQLCLTFAPTVLGGDATPIFGRAALREPPQLALAGVIEEDGHLLLRYQFPGASG